LRTPVVEGRGHAFALHETTAAARPYLLAGLHKAVGGQFFVMVPTTDVAERTFTDLAYFLGEKEPQSVALLRPRDETVGALESPSERSARMTLLADLSARVALSPSPCLRRMRRLERLQLAEQAVRFGITSLQIMFLLPASRYVPALNRAKLPIRIRVIRFPPTGADSRDISDGRDLPRQSLPVSGVCFSGTKWLLDGTPLDRRAALRTEYRDRAGWSGQLYLPEQEMRAMLQESAAIEFKDYFVFLIGQASENLDGAPDFLGGSARAHFPDELAIFWQERDEFLKIDIAGKTILADNSLIVTGRSRMPSMCNRTRRPPLD